MPALDPDRMAAFEQTAFLNVMIELVQQRFYENRIKLLQAVTRNVKSNDWILFECEKYPFLRQVLTLSNSFMPITDDEKNAAIDAVIASTVYDRVKEREDAMDPSLFDHVDELVKELLRWFKQDFFTWVNKLGCSACGNEEQDQIRQVPSCRPYKDEHFLGKASVIERFQCLKCRHVYEFPRYNDISTLLHTRKGRCGEWNNCFIAILRSLDIDVRYIWNAEDHVWCEYFSVKQSRWIHLDSCEESYDQPMLYNHGWGKKMSYVFAVNASYIIDVSSKYIDSHKPEKILPRDKAPEKCLSTILAYTNANKLISLSREELLTQTSQLVGDFKTAKKTEDADINANRTVDVGPRSSGADSEWTVARGEAGDQ